MFWSYSFAYSAYKWHRCNTIESWFTSLKVDRNVKVDLTVSGRMLDDIMVPLILQIFLS